MKKNGVERTLINQKENGDDRALQTKWSSRFPRYKCAQPRNLEEKRNTILFTAESANIANIELLLRTIHSEGQLSLYGAVSSGVMIWLKDAKHQRSTRTPTEGPKHHRTIFHHGSFYWSLSSSALARLFLFLSGRDLST